MMWKNWFFFVLPLLVEAGSQGEVKFRRLLLRPRGSPTLLGKEKQVRSLAECAKTCTSKARCQCRGYGYQKTSRQCHVFSSSLEEDTSAGSISNGLVYYTATYVVGGVGSPCKGDADCDCVTGSVCDNQVCACPPSMQYNATSNQCQQVSTVGLPCSTNQTCTATPNVYCKEGECFCVLGYRFYPGNRSCLATCPSGYGDTYYMPQDGHCLDGNNDNMYWGTMTLEQCWQRCSSDSQCRSFEHSTEKCYLSYNTVLDDPASWKACNTSPSVPSLTYYQRNCA